MSIRSPYFICTRFLFIFAVCAQFLSIVFASEGAESAQAVLVQANKCSDFLRDIKKMPEHLHFLACKETSIHGAAALESMYRVTGPHSAEVESYFIKTAKMPKLRYTCCGWESLPGKTQRQHPTGIYKLNDITYEIGMSSGETNGGRRRSQWKKIPYFYVSVVQYLESP